MKYLRSSKPIEITQKILVLLGCLALSVPLAGYLITGANMRFTGDDYCYGAVAAENGFWKAQWVSYWSKMPYHGNRFSLTFFSDLSGLFGPLSNAVLPGLIIVLLTSVILFTLYQIKTLANLPLRKPECLLISLLLVFFTLYQAPSLAQSLYWRSGTLPYTAPIIINTLVLGLILKHFRKKKAGKWSGVLVAALAFIGGGFSETATAVQIVFLVLLIAGFWAAGKKGIGGASVGIRLVLSALIASGVALLLLAVSPSIDERLRGANHPGFLQFILITLRSAASFAFESLVSQPIPNAVNFLVFVALSYIVSSRSTRSSYLPVKHYLKLVAGIALIGLVLILCVTAPSAFAQSAFPEFRALIIARIITVTMISLAGFTTGYWLEQWMRSKPKLTRTAYLGMTLLVGVLLVYPLYASRNIYSGLPEYAKWSTFWDQRNLAIQQDKQAGIMDLNVVQIDHIIPDVGDLSPDPGHWYNICASQYYGVQTITADQPGWDE